MSNPKSPPDATFEVTSGALCFGRLPNIVQGASAPIETSPSPRPHHNGTVKTQSIVYNLGAKNGKWNVYKLVQIDSSRVEGWCAAHQDVDPLKEIERILRVAGSPYEEEHGDTMNTDTTRREGVFVVNRYDWGNMAGENNDLEEVEEGDVDILANGNSLGLVDFSHAVAYVEDWKQRRPSGRSVLAHGIWLYIPHAEYMFARFGFGEGYTEARSFLFFGQRTNFFNTKFPGQEKPLRKFETERERFQRGLREGKDYSGIEDLRKLCTPVDGDDVYNVFPAPPPASEQLGPYLASKHVLREEDIEVLRVHKISKEDYELLMRQVQTPLPEASIQLLLASYDKQVAEFAEEWKDSTFDLLNELVLSYLEHFILKAFPLQGSITTIGAKLFPNHEQPLKLDSMLYIYLTKPLEQPIPGYDTEAVGSRIKTFLSRRIGEINASSELDLEMFFHGLTRVVAFICSETLELADHNAYAKERPEPSKPAEGGYIVPANIRMAVYYDPDLAALVRYSAVYWSGRRP